MDLKYINLKRVWNTTNSILIIQFCSSEDHLQDLRAKKQLASLPNKKKLDVDFTRLQVEDYEKAKE